MQWIINNISTIKDFLWVAFTLIATIIAILTYRRARFTLLQPVKSEVIKRQTDILLKALDFFGDDIIDKIDYYGIIECNTYVITNSINGFIWKDESIESKLKDIKAYRYMDETIIKSIRVPLSFEEAFNYDLKIKQITEQIKKNDAEFENGRKNRPVFLLLTKKYIEFEKELSRYISNPFLPQHFTSILKNIQVDIEYNINIMIKELLLRYYTSLCEQEPKGDTKISCTPLFNQFNRLKKPHKPDINRLIDNIRKLMLIDHKW